MSIFQLLAILFAFFMMYVVSMHRRKARISFMEVSLWYTMWSIFIVIALFPNLLLGITQVLHFQRVFDLLLVLALMILTSLVVVNYFTQKENQRKLEGFVRKRAIDEQKSKKSA